MTVYSQNGYEANNRALVSRQTVPGTAVRLTVRNDPAGWLLLYVLSRFDKEVEDLDWDSTNGEADDWGYAERPVRGGTDLSNHASGTAVDANATRHPLGARGTFSAPQVAAIRRILGACAGAVRWGGDYGSRPDEMHFEIIKPLTYCQQVWATLTEDDMQLGELINFRPTTGPDGAGRNLWDAHSQTMHNLHRMEAKIDAGFGELRDDEADVVAAVRSIVAADQGDETVVTDAQLDAALLRLRDALPDSVEDARIEAAVARVFARAAGGTG